MNITNKFDLPLGIVDAIKNREYSKGEADISVTSLLMPPQMYRLLALHGKDIEVDASENIWALFGTAVHHILALADNASLAIKEELWQHYLRGSLNEETISIISNKLLDSGEIETLTEERLYLKVADWILSGQPDIYRRSLRLIEDYKVTSVYKVQAGDYDDWAFQLNCYKLLLESSKQYPVEQLRIVAIMRDWSFKEARSGRIQDYPKTQVQSISIPVWKPIDTLLEIAKRIKGHQAVLGLNREQLPQCTAEDRWAGQSSYNLVNPDKPNYVYRAYPFDESIEGDDKRAETEAFITLAGMKAVGYKVQKRSGFNMRCEYFCPVREVCFQRSQTKPEVFLPTNEVDIDTVATALGLGESVHKETADGK